MPPKRRRDNADDDEQEKVTWISDQLYKGTRAGGCCSALSSFVDLNDQRQSGRERLNSRLSACKLTPRTVRSVPRPRGEAGRKSNGEHRDGFTLKDILKRENNVNAEHYAMIQV
jgi:hypothetical protein